MKKILGIDLGTTYCCVAHVNEFGIAEVIPNGIDERTTPSVVWFEGDRATVGREAKEMAPVHFHAVCSFVKRNMGSETFYFEVGDLRYSPEHVSSLILRKLVQDASEALGEQITDVVITCPAYFFIKERDATKRAGEMAGLNVLQIVNEPTAAAIAYGVRPGESDAEKSVVMVYDLGGGTFDVTLIHVTPDGMDVICTDGDHHLGGKDWDDRLVRHFARRFSEETGVPLDLGRHPELYQELLQRAEQTKKQLTAKESTTVKFAHDGEIAKFDISREEFENMTRDLLENTITQTRSLLEVASQKGFHRFDKLILVGGSSRMPMIQKRLQEEFAVAPVLFDPDEAVAKGAAIIGNNLRLRKLVEEKLRRQDPSRELTINDATPEQIDEATQSAAVESGYTLEIVQKAMKRVRNVTSKSFGSVVTVDFKPDGEPVSGVVNMIYRNTPLPASDTKTFATMRDNQVSVYTAIAENMADKTLTPDGREKWVPLEESKILWEGALKMLPGLPAGSPTTDTYQIDENGLLTLISEDPASGNRIVQKIETGHSEIVDASSPETRHCRDLVVE